MKIPCWKCEQKTGFQVCPVCLDTGYGELDTLEAEAHEELRIYMKLRHAAMSMVIRAQAQLAKESKSGNVRSMTLRRRIELMHERLESADETVIEMFARIEEYRKQEQG